MKLVGRRDGTGRAQQVERRTLRAPRRLDHRLVLGGVLVRLEQDAVQLRANRFRAAALDQLGRPGVDLGRLCLLALDRQQRGLHRLAAGLVEHALADTLEIVRRVEQTEQHPGLVHGVGLRIEVFARQLGKAEVGVRRELPGEFGVDLDCQRARALQQRGRLGCIESQQHVRRLDLDAAPRIELDLQRCVGVRHHATGEELAGVIEQGVGHQSTFVRRTPVFALRAARRAGGCRLSHRDLPRQGRVGDGRAPASAQSVTNRLPTRTRSAGCTQRGAGSRSRNASTNSRCCSKSDSAWSPPSSSLMRAPA